MMKLVAFLVSIVQKVPVGFIQIHFEKKVFGQKKKNSEIMDDGLKQEK